MEKKIIRKSKTVKLTPDLIAKIEKVAAKQKRKAHYVMVEALERAFK